VVAVVNGESRTLADGTTIAALLAVLELGNRRVAVEVNQDLVPKTEFSSRVIRDGDHLEIVHFVGGG
jgi:thiamine biosynthesis protein ThiS